MAGEYIFSAGFFEAMLGKKNVFKNTHETSNIVQNESQ